MSTATPHTWESIDGRNAEADGQPARREEAAIHLEFEPPQG
jgi:hypothetical protein